MQLHSQIRGFRVGKRRRSNPLSLTLSVVFLGSCLTIFLLGFLCTSGDALQGENTFPCVNSKSCCWGAEEDLVRMLFRVSENDLDGSCPRIPDKGSYAEDVAQEKSGAQTLSKQEKIYGLGAKENVALENDSEINSTKSDRLTLDVPPKLDEFKHKATASKEKSMSGQAGSITHQIEPGGEEYNYASSAKGAKVLASNKEAKGASNILGKDMDKYLRNPCSAEDKFVILELSEETLVYTIEIANFEHYSSNLKEFAVLGSLIYPTEMWVNLGNFTAKNIKQSQRFQLEEPKWVRYLKLHFLGHHGSEFYCTLSTVKVYGVDAVERMLEDLISDSDDLRAPAESDDEKKQIPSSPMPSQTDKIPKSCSAETNVEDGSEDSMPKDSVSKSNPNVQVRDIQPQPVGRLPGDSVLKILTKKMRSLDINISILERYLEEINSRYGDLFKELDEEVAEKASFVENMRSDMANLLHEKENIVKDVSDMIAWKLIVSSRVDILKTENALLRSEIKRVLEVQKDSENKGIVVLLMTSICVTLAFVKLIVDLALNVISGKQKFGEFCKSKLPWIFLLLSSGIVGTILLV